MLIPSHGIKVWLAPMTRSIEDAVTELRNEGWPIGLTVTQNQAPGYAKEVASYDVPWERDHLGRYGPPYEKSTCPNLVSIHYDRARITSTGNHNIVIGPGENLGNVSENDLESANEVAVFVGRRLVSCNAVGDVNWETAAPYAGHFRLHNADYIKSVRWDICSGINIGPELCHYQMIQLIAHDNVTQRLRNAVLHDDRVKRWNCANEREALICCGHYHLREYVPMVNYIRHRLEELL